MQKSRNYKISITKTVSNSTHSHKSIDAIQGGYTVGLGHCRIIKGAVHKIIDSISAFCLLHNRLTDMNNF